MQSFAQGFQGPQGAQGGISETFQVYDINDQMVDVGIGYQGYQGLQGAQGDSTGWLPTSETWTYASATTFTIVGDKTTIYSKGDKIQLTQTTVKYFYVVGVSFAAGNTTITITGGSDYTLANAVITLNLFSKAVSPNGFPIWFNWSPTVTGFTSPPAGSAYRFTVVGNTCKLAIFQNNATSNATTLTISLPITSTTAGSMLWGAVALVVDNGGRLSSPGYVLVNAAATVLTCFKDVTLAGFTASGSKAVNAAMVDYEF